MFRMAYLAIKHKSIIFKLRERTSNNVVSIALSGILVILGVNLVIIIENILEAQVFPSLNSFEFRSLYKFIMPQGTRKLYQE